MKCDALKNISILNVNDKENIRNTENIYVGPECENFLKTLSCECAQQIKLNCFFLI